ncbi:MAG TPA: adenylyltransferase, partial [Ruminococcaceae bacterium]|nr:adenylyltransferase [Oscillospiraceae bacterium]
TCRQAGVVGAVAGVIGALQAVEAIKYLVGAGDLLTGYMLTYDALKMEFRKIKLPRRESCEVCGPHPTILKPFDYEQKACDLKS